MNILEKLQDSLRKQSVGKSWQAETVMKTAGKVLAMRPKKETLTMVVAYPTHTDIRVFSTNKLSLLSPARELSCTATSAHITPDGKHIIIGDTDGVVRIFDIDHHQPKISAYFESPNGEASGGIRSVKLSPDGETAMITKPFEVEIINVHSGKSLFYEPVQSISADIDTKSKKAAVILKGRRQLRLLDLNLPRKPIRDEILSISPSLLHLNHNPKSPTCAIVSPELVTIIPLEGKRVQKIVKPFSKDGERIIDANFDPVSGEITIGGTGIAIYDLTEDRLSLQLEIPGLIVSKMKTRPDDGVVFFAASSGKNNVIGAIRR